MKTKRKKSSVSVRISRGAVSILGDRNIIRNLKIYRNPTGRIGSSTSYTVSHAVDPSTSQVPSPDPEIGLEEPEDWGETNMQEDDGIDQGGDQTCLVCPFRPFSNLFSSCDLASESTHSRLAAVSTNIP
jgi:hypothetical protein